MMINNVTLVGRLTKQVDLKYTQSGIAVASFTLAVDRTFKNQNGEKETDFINCVAWKHSAEALANYTDKGHRVGLVGRIQTRNYEGQNGRVYVTEVVAESVQFLEPKQSSNQSQNNVPQTRIDEDPFQSGQPIDITDDGLPF